MRTVWILVLSGLAGLTLAGERYVSPSGDDGAVGSREAPFATLKAAREAVRELKAQHPAEEITVWFDEGSYVFTETEVFGLDDSGSAGL